jgi:hypothetical protein
MGIYKRLNRSIVFRMTDEEYESLRAAFAREGGRSLSDFLRSVIVRSVSKAQDDSSESKRLRNLERRVRRLEQAQGLAASTPRRKAAS